MSYRTEDGEHFKTFATSLEQLRIQRGYDSLNDDQLLALQRQQLECLHNLENEFRAKLIAHRWGPGVYRAFIKKICEENGNILTSRPYFRERQDVCIGPISKALDERDIESLHRFHFNYNFVLFTMKLYRWRPKSKLTILAQKIRNARQDIVILNMPLAISQARIFWSKAPAKAPSCHLTYLDFIQISSDGLLSAVDKFVLPNPKKFRGDTSLLREFRRFRPMAVQRMVGNFIEAFSETMLHFFPKDKRKLYRANKWLAKHSGTVDFQQLSLSVNKDAKGRFVESAARTNPIEIADLIAAADRIISTESNAPANEEDEDKDKENHLDSYADAEESRPDVSVERFETSEKLHGAIALLTVLERKLLRERGVNA